MKSNQLKVLSGSNILLSGFITAFLFDRFYFRNPSELDEFYTLLAFFGFLSSVIGGNIRRVLNPHLIKTRLNSLSLILLMIAFLAVSVALLYCYLATVTEKFFPDFSIHKYTTSLLIYLSLFVLAQFPRSLLEVKGSFVNAERIALAANVVYAVMIYKLDVPSIEPIFEFLIFKASLECFMLGLVALRDVLSLRLRSANPQFRGYLSLTFGSAYYKSEGVFDRFLVQAHSGFVASLSLSATVISAAQTFFMKTRVVPLTTKFASLSRDEQYSEYKATLKSHLAVIDSLTLMSTLGFLAFVVWRGYESSVVLVAMTNTLFFRYSLAGCVSSSLLNCIGENRKQVFFGVITFTIFIVMKFFAAGFAVYAIPILTGMFFALNYYYQVWLLGRLLENERVISD